MPNLLPWEVSIKRLPSIHRLCPTHWTICSTVPGEPGWNNSIIILWKMETSTYPLLVTELSQCTSQYIEYREHYLGWRAFHMKDVSPGQKFSSFAVDYVVSTVVNSG